MLLIFCLCNFYKSFYYKICQFVNQLLQWLILQVNLCSSTMFSWQTYNALFVVRCYLKFLVQNVKESEVIRHIEAQGKSILQINFTLLLNT